MEPGRCSPRFAQLRKEPTPASETVSAHEYLTSPKAPVQTRKRAPSPDSRHSFRADPGGAEMKRVARNAEKAAQRMNGAAERIF